MPVPQFGAPEPGRDYPDRPAAFGIAEKGEAIALVRVEKDGKSWLDLPGGALDPGSSAPRASGRRTTAPLPTSPPALRVGGEET